MQKRGSFLLRYSFELALGAILVVLFLSLANKLGTQEYYVKQSVADETALLISALSAVPGNVVISYPIDPTYIIRLEKDAVIINDILNIRASLTGNVKPAEVTNSPVLNIYKNGNEISLSASNPSLTQRGCDRASINRNNLRLELPPAIQTIANILGFKCTNNVCATDAQSISSATTVLTVAPATSGVTARFSNGESKALACNLLNSILARDPTAQTWLVPSNSKATRTVDLEIEPAKIETVGRIVQESS